MELVKKEIENKSLLETVRSKPRSQQSSLQLCFSWKLGCSINETFLRKVKPTIPEEGNGMSHIWRVLWSVYLKENCPKRRNYFWKECFNFFFTIKNWYSTHRALMFLWLFKETCICLFSIVFLIIFYNQERLYLQKNLFYGM